MPMIRDTIDPLNEREVSDEEFTDLDRQGIVLTGTRARTPEGLRAAAVRQVTDLQAERAAAGLDDQPPPAPEATEDDVADDDEHEVDVDVDVDDQDSGADPVSTTEHTPARTSNQES